LIESFTHCAWKTACLPDPTKMNSTKLLTR